MSLLDTMYRENWKWKLWKTSRQVDTL